MHMMFFKSVGSLGYEVTARGDNIMPLYLNPKDATTGPGRVHGIRRVFTTVYVRRRRMPVSILE